MRHAQALTKLIKSVNIHTYIGLIRTAVVPRSSLETMHRLQQIYRVVSLSGEYRRVYQKVLPTDT